MRRQAFLLDQLLSRLLDYLVLSLTFLLPRRLTACSTNDKMPERLCTVILPAARDGADGRPAWLRVHPHSSEIVLFQILRQLDLSLVRRIVLVVKKSHVDEYLDAGLKTTADKICFEVLALDTETTSGPETVVRALEAKKIEGPIFVKDSDGCFDHKVEPGNYVVGYKVTGAPGEYVDCLPKKSFLGATGNVLTVIQEKQMISDVISVGGYSFENAAQFVATYRAVQQVQHDTALCLKGVSGHGPPRIFLSHIVQSMMLADNCVFGVSYCSSFDDWKSEAAWRNFLSRHQNVVVQLEGVLLVPIPGTSVVKVASGSPDAFSPVTQNIDYLRELHKAGRSRIVVTSTRPDSHRQVVEDLLKALAIPYDSLLLGQMGSTTFVVSSYGNGLPHPSSVSYCVPSGASQLGSVLHLN